MNPSYKASINSNQTTDITPSKRSEKQASTQLNCGMPDCKTGEYRYATQAESVMYDTGGWIGAAARTCQRMTCRGTTGTYVSNSESLYAGPREQL
jgi:hypothetical protein